MFSNREAVGNLLSLRVKLKISCHFEKEPKREGTPQPLTLCHDLKYAFDCDFVKPMCRR